MDEKNINSRTEESSVELYFFCFNINVCFFFLLEIMLLKFVGSKLVFHLPHVSLIIIYRPLALSCFCAKYSEA